MSIPFGSGSVCLLAPSGAFGSSQSIRGKLSHYLPPSCVRKRRMIIAAVVQMTSTSDEEGNWRSARELIGRAAAAGAGFVATPECTNYLGPHAEKVRRAERLGERTTERFAALAKELKIHLLLGSYNERSEGASPFPPKKCANTSVLFSPEGKILKSYRKIHMFDVDIPGGVKFSESETCESGGEVVVAKTPFGKLGLSICYDLRFPELYRVMTQQGAEIHMVPSAFTLATGKDHWEPLLRARAIETQSYVLAPAQYGKHDDDGLKESWGHSMIVDPWGQVIASVSDGVGFALAEIDLERVRRIRRAIPVAKHRRL